jgi:hypothetical protein
LARLTARWSISLLAAAVEEDITPAVAAAREDTVALFLESLRGEVLLRKALWL